MPQRIQLKRTKGWRKPDGAIIVARPTKWGNPFKIGERIACDDERFVYVERTLPNHSFETSRAAITISYSSLTILDHQKAVDAFTWWLIEQPDLMLSMPHELAGHDLACWCPLDQPCHADSLLELANYDRSEVRM